MKRGPRKRASVAPGLTQREQRPELEQLNPHAAGVDIGATSHWVCVPSGAAEQTVQEFGCYTTELYRLADWLAECGIETVAMESTGVYWIALFQILESRGFEVKLVNAHAVKAVPGRKSDVKDCQWLQQLHSYGLLSGSFRPDEQICVLRSYLRQRETLVHASSTHIQRMQKALSQMNVQLHQVVSDITGVTGMRIIRAIGEGERCPETLAAMRDPRCQRSQAEIAAALTGDYRAEHLFVLQQELELYDSYQTHIARCDAQIQQCLGQFETAKPEQPPLPPERQRKNPRRTAAPAGWDLQGELYRISGVDFTTIDGLGALTVQTILSEVGLDPSRFASVKHFTSWLGLCPGSRISGGKVLSSRTRKVVNRAANAFRMAAESVANSQTALGAFYRRIRSRLGPPKANTATAHKIARLFYRLWTTGTTYTDTGADYYEQKYQQRVLKHLQKRATQLGFQLVPHPTEPEVS